jgi:riboflavin biosynthesis pyrimidine reductase
MAEVTRNKYVVILDRKASKPAKEVAAELQALPGIEVTAESDSFLDLKAEKEAVSEVDLAKAVEKLGAQLHTVSEPELIDPIPPSKIPF